MNTWKRDSIKRVANRYLFERTASSPSLYLVLQGVWKGLQEAKKDPKINKKLSKSIEWFEKFVVSIGKKAKDPSFRLTKAQVDKLNTLLYHWSRVGKMSPIIKRNITQHCGDNGCAIDGGSFRFEVIEDKDLEGAVIKTLGDVRKEFSDSQKNVKSHRDSSMFEWKKDSSQSLKDFESQIYSQWRGLPGTVKFYFDPEEKNHFAFARYNTF